jgi:D-lactate dehydrogenase
LQKSCKALVACKLLAYNPYPSETGLKLCAQYFEFNEVCRQGNTIILHCPLNNATRHIIATQAIDKMKPVVMLINTERWALIDITAIIQALKMASLGT